MGIDPYYERDGIQIFVGDNREVLPHVGQVHAVVTDPPAGIAFMGKDWDANKGGRDQWIAWLAETLRGVSDTMLPGAHALIWALPRTSGWTSMAIEDAGLDVRDCITHLFGSGFPKSHSVSNSIDKMQGHPDRGRAIPTASIHLPNGKYATEKLTGNKVEAYKARTPEAEQWQGWGTALKPAAEFWYLARKPFPGTVAQNVLTHGTGAINVDACRIGDFTNDTPSGLQRYRTWSDSHTGQDRPEKPGTVNVATGRWPSNVILDEAAALQMGEPARYFYCAKSSRRERNAGLDGMPERTKKQMMRSANSTGDKNFVGGFPDTIESNHHPTVKPLALMRYLIQLVTPPGGIVLDPFMGSGSTLVAAAELGFSAIGIELSEEYAEIAARRVDYALNQRSGYLTGLERSAHER